MEQTQRVRHLVDRRDPIRDISVADAAQLMSLSTTRVRQLVDEGQLRARKVGRMWLIDPTSMPLERPGGRPLSARLAWGTLLSACSRQVPWVDSRDKGRISARLKKMAGNPGPEYLSRALFPNRATRLEFMCPEPTTLSNEQDVRAAGVFAPLSQMSSASFFEGYVRAEDLDYIKGQHLLTPAALGPGNVVLHVTQYLPEGDLPPSVIAADLSEHLGARELARARALWLEILR